MIKTYTHYGSIDGSYPPRERHLARAEINVEILADWFRTGRIVRYQVTEGIPEDAAVVGFYVDEQSRLVNLVFEHESFPVVRMGDRIHSQHVTICSTRELEEVP